MYVKIEPDLSHVNTEAKQLINSAECTYIQKTIPQSIDHGQTQATNSMDYHH